MLTTYLTETAQLLQNPAAPTSLYSTSDLTGYINRARCQIAIENECIRTYATLAMSAPTQEYNFSSINVSGNPGCAGVLNIRMVSAIVGTATVMLNPQPWEWFNQYLICTPSALTPGPPTDWTQYAQGQTGTLFVSPAPDLNYQLNLDTVCVPIYLVDDTTYEAIPYPWTDCVPFFAAFYALLGAQSQARQADAQRMFALYETFKQRARTASNPSVERWQYPQSGPPVRNIPVNSGSGAA